MTRKTPKRKNITIKMSSCQKCLFKTAELELYQELLTISRAVQLLSHTHSTHFLQTLLFSDSADRRTPHSATAFSFYEAVVLAVAQVVGAVVQKKVSRVTPDRNSILSFSTISKAVNPKLSSTHGVSVQEYVVNHL